MFRLVDKASGHRFEFGSGRFLGYSCRGVKNVIFGYYNNDVYEQIQALAFQKSWRSFSIMYVFLHTTCFHFELFELVHGYLF